MALRTFTSAGVNTLWSNALNWDTGVPVDTDTFALAAAQTCTFDVDQTAFAGLGASTIAAGTTLIASTTAGAYVLKMNADLTVNGTLQAGTSVAVPYPSTCTFFINYSNAAYSTEVGAAGKLYLYCTEPTNRYIALSASEAAGQTILSVDTNVTGDIWADGNTITIDDISGSLIDSESRVIAAGGIAASTITVTAGLTNAKASGAYVILITRNIKITNSTDYAIRFNASSTGSNVGCEISNCTNGIFSGISNTLSGVITCPNGYGINVSSANTINGIIGGCTYGVSPSSSNVSAFISGCNNGLYGGNGYIFSGTITGCANGVRVGQIGTISGTVKNCSTGFYEGVGHTISGNVINCQNGIYLCTGIVFTGTLTGFVSSTTGFWSCHSCIISGSISNCGYGVYFGTNYQFNTCAFTNNTNDLWGIYSGRSYNSSMGGTTEFGLYNSSTFRAPYCYFESFDHDQIINAYKAWVLGGIVASQTASPPSGYTIWYQLQCESATYPCFRQYQTVVLPGTAIEVTGLMRINDAADHTVYPPRLQIIDAFADPLVDDTQNPLDESQMADPDGSDSSWQTVSVIWANQGDSPRTVLVRMIAKHATGDVDTVWAVADYQDQINAIYTKLPTNYIMGSSDVDNHDTTIDTINTNIGTPANIDSGGATLSANLQKIADDNAGATFDATRDSLNVIRTRGDLAWATGTSVGATSVYTIVTLVRTVGDNDGGASTAVNVQDGSYFSTGEVTTTTKLEVDATFTATSDETPMNIQFWGYYVGGGGHYLRVQAYNYVDSTFEDVGTLGNGTVAAEYAFGLTAQHINTSTGAMAVKFLHSAHAGVIAHVLHIDKLIVTTSHNAALITAVEAILVDTNEIQGKLPDDYIMGSSVTTSMDDEIDNINANSGKVVYGSVTGTGGIPRSIQTGSATGFVEDEKL